jgi:hypothetical protein
MAMMIPLMAEANCTEFISPSTVITTANVFKMSVQTPEMRF